MRPTAVVCDDDYAARQVAAFELRDAGYDVVAEVALATDLLAVVGALRPALVVVDVSLMGMTGIEAIPDIRRLSPASSVVVFSAFDSAREAALAAGADAVVDKTEVEDLAAVASRLLPTPPPADAAALGVSAA